MITLIHIDSLNGVNYHRLIVPLRRLSSTSDVQFHWIKKLTELKDMDLSLVDNLIISRKASITNHRNFRRMLDKYNVRLILDNDDYWNLNYDNPAYPIYEGYVKHDIQKTIAISDELWTPSRFLAKQMKRLNEKAVIRVIPNTINTEEEQWSVPKGETDVVRFGYVGALGHAKDLELMGMTFEDYELYCANIGLYVEQLKAKYAMDALDIFNYGRMYAMFDVSLAPLSGGKFNNSKSDLKVVEAGYTKTALIASNITPYKQSIEHGKTGILCSNYDDWKYAIKNMTLEHAKELAGNLNEFVVNNYDLDDLNKIRLEGVQSIKMDVTM